MMTVVETVVEKNKVDENKIEPSIYRYILKHTKKDQLLLLLLTAISMPFVYASLEVPKVIINSALGGVDIPEQILGYPMDQVKYLFFLCALFLVLVLTNGGLKYVINVYRGVLGERMLRRFRFDLFARLLRFPIPRFKQVSQGEIIPMITAETEPLGGFIGDAFALPAFQGGLLLTYLFFIFNQDFLLGLAAIALYPPQLYIIPKLQRRVNELAKQRVQAVRTFSDKVGETVSGISDVHINATSNYEKAHASSRLARIYDIRFNIYKKKFFIKFLNNFLAQLTPFFFYGIGGYFVITGKLSLGALVAVLAAYKDLASPWKELLKYYQITEDVRVKYKQIIDQFQTDKMLKPSLQEQQAETGYFQDSSVQGTSLSYSEDEFVKSLDGVNFEIKAGDHVGILGLGGSGRGVLTQLVARLVQPNFGSIRISGQNIAELPESMLGVNIAYIDQRSYVFTGTVRENLLYGLKTNPQTQVEYSGAEQQQRQKYIDDSKAAANSIDDVQADWVNIKATGAEDLQSFNQYLFKTLQIAGLENDVYQLGLYSSINASDYPDLAQGILDARQKLRQQLQQDDYSELVEILDATRYNTNMTVAENLLFGMPVESGVRLDNLLSNPVIDHAIEQADLKKSLLEKGHQAAKVMVDLFSDVPEGSPMFERFSFVSIDDLPNLARLSNTSDESLDSINSEDQQVLINLAFKLNVARHRLGLITPEIQQKVINAHAILKEKLGEENDLIEFNSDTKVSSYLTVQDNILFGRVVYGQANANQKVGKLIQNMIDELGLKEKIIEVGLDYSVGVGGAKLTSVQRQKLTIARALIKNSQILIVNEATAIFEGKVEKAMIERMLDLMQGRTVFWVLDNTDHMDNFDTLLVLDKGKLVAEGSVAEIKNQAEIMDRLSQG